MYTSIHGYNYMYTGVHSDAARESGTHQNKHDTLIQVQIPTTPT